MSLSTFTNDFKDKKILIFGLGILGGGEGVVKVFDHIGATIRITDSKSKEDLKEVLAKLPTKNIDKLTLGQHKIEDVQWADVIVKNPGVPTSSPLINEAIELGKRVTTEAALFLKYSDSTTIGITGSRGKTTTTLMIYEIFHKAFGEKVLLGGNMQNKGTLPLLIDEKPDSISILELSSWALEGCHWEKVSPKVAIVTNISPDHLNRYQNLEQYVQDKVAISQYQTSENYLFIQEGRSWTKKFTTQTQARIHYISEELSQNVILKIPGKHNQMNANFAMAVANHFHIDDQTVSLALSEFNGTPYRQQFIAEKHGIKFYNDSTSTTPTALITALETFPTATFIIGGTSKNLPVDNLAKKIQSHVGEAVFLEGSGTSELLAHLSQIMSTRGDSNIRTFNNLSSAFKQAVNQTQQGEIVFSPGFTSFEMFKNEFDRAIQFDELVQNL